MNLMQWLVGLFNRDLTEGEKAVIEQSARQKARESATVFATAFTDELSNVLTEHTTGFHVLDTEAVAVEHKQPKRLTKKGGR